VIVAWQKQMKERKLDGGKLIATVQALLAKYAGEPEAQPSQPQPAEQKVVTEPQQSPQAKAEVTVRPKADAPAAAPVAKPAPAAATVPKELDIPL